MKLVQICRCPSTALSPGRPVLRGPSTPVGGGGVGAPAWPPLAPPPGPFRNPLVGRTLLGPAGEGEVCPQPRVGSSLPVALGPSLDGLVSDVFSYLGTGTLPPP